MITVTDDSVVDAVEEAVQEASLDPETNLRWDYSGRHMYGRDCLALTGSLDDLVRFVATLTQTVDEASRQDGLYHGVVGELLALHDAVQRDTRQDQLGLGQVFYWPHVRRSP